MAAALPRGHGLPEWDWERRHHGMLFVLWAHAASIFLYVLLRDRDLLHAVVEGGVVSIAGLAASWPRARRRFQAISACVGLLTSSAILVHLSGGYIEMHFHFFVMVPLMALYQDWVPFLAAIAYVVLHHGTVGVLDASQVYNHPAAWASPWTWPAIHGIFVLGASVVSCITWRLNELAAAEAAASAQRFGNLVQNLDAVVWEADPDNRVLAAGSSEEALRLADGITGPIDLLITDVVMSGMNGIALAERLTMKRPETKVLYMTAYRHDAVAGLGALRGSALPQKPFTPHDLATRIREVLGAVRV